MKSAGEGNVLVEADNPEDVLRFAAAFDGRKDAYGIGAGGVVREAVTSKLYSNHLRGFGSGLGIFPLRDDGTVRFAAIDLDEPDFDLAAEIAAFIPGDVFLESSRSGNAHLWAFFAAPCPAWVARGNLKLALEAAGKPRVEIFPKQDSLVPGMLGNYINLPFHGDDRPMLWRTGDENDYTRPGYTLFGFLEGVDEIRIDPEHWRRLAVQAGVTPPGTVSDEGDMPWGTRPTLHHCATYMLQHKNDNPVTVGHRNIAFFSLAKMLLNCKDYDVEETIEIVDGYNEAGTDPVPRHEIIAIVRNAVRGEFTSTGCDDPLMAPYVDPDCPIANG
jgi:hypothetical protein